MPIFALIPDSIGVPWVYVGIFAGASAVWLLIWWLDPNLRRKREFALELTHRTPLPDAEFVAQSFDSCNLDPEIPSKVRQIFAKHMEYPAEKLFADDDFTFFWAELDMVDMVREIESRFGVQFPNVEIERTPCTIRAVSLLVAHKAH